MTASRDDVASSDGLLAAAQERACVFDFAAAEHLCQSVLALEVPGSATDRAQSLLRAIEYNRTSYLYDLARKRPAESGAAPAQGSAARRLHDAWTRLWRRDSSAFIGSYEVRFDDKFMVVSGSVRDESRLVHVFINELIVASVPTMPAEPGAPLRRQFEFRIGKRSLSLFPADSEARLAISTGKDLLRHADDAFYHCRWPGGKGGIEAAILKGAMLTTHHQIQTPPAVTMVDRWLDAYETVAAFMRAETGKPRFLYYGSLLGAVRDNRIIPFDDDFDVGYFSAKQSPPEVKDEMISIIAALAAAPPDMVIRLMNFFFKIRSRDGIVDVFPAWHDGRVLWSPWSTRLECNEEDLLKQVEERRFHGRRVLVPARAERFLELKYGANWRTPDPAYRVRELPPEAYPFRRIPFGEEDRTRILEAARQIAGDGPVATIKLMNE
jgi:hypothetical protein